VPGEGIGVSVRRLAERIGVAMPEPRTSPALETGGASPAVAGQAA
jgi:hypothetical protein